MSTKFRIYPHITLARCPSVTIWNYVIEQDLCGRIERLGKKVDRFFKLSAELATSFCHFLLPSSYIAVSGGTRAATVGTPVTRRPPCSPGRAVFPHPVPRLHSHPRRAKPCLLWPAGRLAHTAPVRHVRDECPFRAACFRRVLPHVAGFPHLRVLRSIRLPIRMRWAFPVTVLLHLPGRVPQRCAGSSIVPCPGFPFRASGAVYHTPTFSTAGTAGASQVLRRLSSCMPRPEDSGGPAPPCQDGGARVAFGSVKTLGVRNSHVEAVPALQGARSPLRPTGYAVYASSILFARIETPTPPWTQDSLRVGGEPLPDRDFHPARDAKLILAR